MNNPKARLVKLLELKLSLFESLEKNLVRQNQNLDNKEFERFLEKSGEAENIIKMVKSTDYDIARLESIEESVAGMVNSDDKDIKSIVNKIIKISRKNHRLMDELTRRLTDLYGELKDTLGDTAEIGKIRGYKNVTMPSPIYFDKTG